MEVLLFILLFCCALGSELARRTLRPSGALLIGVRLLLLPAALATQNYPLRMPNPRTIVAGVSCQNGGGIVPRMAFPPGILRRWGQGVAGRGGLGGLALSYYHASPDGSGGRSSGAKGLGYLISRFFSAALASYRKMFG